ncbi:unnamed protein product [Tetraodon nigroviridis]|uniref:Signal recognition particle 9 kDa protein n=1 Tax=Tetraodon nigroviridis TaxID=99883 RepID=Q4SRE7_TETNG|nr:unnamed protein product [Tetraodon nigroviridis]
MPYYQVWEEFSRAVEKLYLTDPMKVRVVLKYRHCDGNLCIKVTDNSVVSYEMRLFGVQKDNFALEHSLLHRHVVMKCMCLQYKTDQAQDVKKIEKLHGKLMRLMVSKESHSGAMETD